jgi:DNA-binding PadR family transcriptional regulator
MSPVFRHGRLRLYLLKLLDESPRHGYEVIRLLQDRFMGVYSPSPGTIYPRLARLEEEGLVTHDESEGRKVYRITDKGREELRNRSDDLTELEDELTASVRDIAREVTEDVRETVRSLREELTWAARDIHGEHQARGRGRGPSSRGAGAPGDDPGDQDRATGNDADAWTRAASEDAREQARAAGQDAGEQARAAGQDAREQTRAARDHARQAAATARENARQAREEARRGRGRRESAPGGEQGERGWGGWQDWQAWTDWPGRRGWPGPPGASGWADPGSYRDLERMARRFTGELRAAAMHAHAVSEDALGDLRAILDDTLDRIRSEIFGEDPPDAPDDADTDTDTGTGEHSHDS